VVAIEPTDYAFVKLTANAGRNRDCSDRLILVQAMLGEPSERPSVAASAYARWPLREGGPDRHAEHLGQLESATAAKFATLDGLLDDLRATQRISGPASFVKLDVDGNELGVLRGAPRTFGVERPAMLIEIAPHAQDEVPERFEALIATLRGFNYRLEDAVSGKPMPMSAEALRKLIKHGASVDAIARPVR
jgi:FkbM family methyltransferase